MSEDVDGPDLKFTPFAVIIAVCNALSGVGDGVAVGVGVTVGFGVGVGTAAS